MQKTIEILTINPAKTGMSKAGKPYSITECECVVQDADGVRKVGVLTLGSSIDPAKLSPGVYSATFDISISYKDRKIGANVVNLTSIQQRPVGTIQTAPTLKA